MTDRVGRVIIEKIKDKNIVLFGGLMKEYQKINTLYRFDGTTKKYTNEITTPEIDYLKDLPWLASEKVDGMNIRVEYDGYRVSWSGRTDKSQLPKEVEGLLQKTFGESEVIFEQNFGNKEVMLFMECYGGKIQGGVYGGSERLIGFDVMINGMYLDKRVIKDIFNYFGVETVEFFEVGSLTRLIDKVKDNIKMGVKDMSKYATEDKPTEKEGFVCVPNVRLLDAQGNRIIVKVKYRDLAKCQE